MQTSPSQQHSLLPAQILRPEDRMTGSNPVSPSSSGSPASSGGMSPLHLGQLMNDSIDGIETPRFHTRSSAASAPNQWDSLPDQSPKVPKLDKNQSEILEQAKHEAKIENRIAELKKEGFWSTRRLSKVPEPARPKVHWDYLCEEMQWLAADFAQERRWKRGVARKVVRMVIRHHEDLKQKEEKAKRDEQAKLRRIAASVAKEIRQFWTNVEKVVQFKQQSRLEEKRKKTLDLQLDFIVGQTEKYSDLLTQSLNVTLVPSKTDSVNTASTASSPLHSAGAREDEDGDFQPLDEEDDEETIEVEEQQEGNDLETQRKEVEQLKRESELPLEELLQSLPQQILASSCSDDDDEEEDEEEDTDVEEEGEEDDDDDDDASKSLESESNLAGQKEDIVSNLEEDDEEFTANEEEAEDEEETIEAEEAMDGKVDHAAELNQLALEGEMPIEELLQQYSDFQKEKWESLSASSLSQQGSEEDYEDEEETSQLDSAEEEDEEEEESEAEAEAEEEDENEDIGMAYLLQGTEDHGGRPVDSSRIDNTGPKKEITDIAATAESLQPKGYTLATAQVKTPVPFLLHGTLREYQHIGLDWLVTMYEKKLNGILADEMGLGKTIQTISLLAHLAIEKGNWGPHLIIVPTSVMLNWEMELKRWCPSFKILTYYGSQKERKLKRQGWTKPNAFHVCITSYKLVLQDHQAFRRKNWKYLILDEAQNIKNFKSQRWQSLLRFNSQRRLLLTGTPLQNSLMELWSLMHFLMPHVFQSHREFKEWFSNPLTGMIEGSQEYNEGLIKRLHKVLRPFLLRRVKVDVEKQMPKKYEHVIHCRLSKRQRYLYDDFMAQAATRETLASGHFMSVINILMQLRKVCNHPNLFDPRPIHSPFITEGICFTTASLALQALERDPFKHVDLDIFDLINLECRVSRYESDIFLPKRKVSRLLIEEIAESPDPPPRPKPVKMKVNRMFQPVPKPEGRPVVMVNSPRVSTPLQKNPAMMDISVPAPPVLPVAPVQPVTTVQPVDLIPPVTPISQVSPMPHVSDTPQVLPASLPLEIPLAESGPILLPPQTQVQTSTAFVPALGLNTSAATTTVTSLQGPVSTPQVLPMTQMPQKDPKSLAPPVTTASTTSGMRASPLPPPDVRMPQSGVSPGSIAGIARPPIAQTTTGLAGYSFPTPGNIQQRLLLSPDMQARLPSGEVISIAQLASLANRPTQNMPGTKPITFQLHGNRLTLSGPNLRQMSMAQPRQLQGNVVHLVSAGGQHHIISQPAHMALLQAMAQQQQQQQQPPPQLQQSGQVQAGVQTLALQAMPPTPQPTLLTTTIPSVTAAAGTTAINAGAQAGVTVSGLVPQISTTAAPLAPMPPSSTTSILGLRNLTTIASPVNNMASQEMTLSSPAPLPLPHSLIALGSVTTTVTQPLATNPPLVQVPTCNLSSALASRPLTTATLLPSTLISAPSSTASVAPLQNTDSPSTLAPSLSLKVASDHSCLVPSLWPLASTPPILVSGQFSNPVPVLATTLPSGTTSMLTSTVASSSTFLQAPPLPSPNLTPQLTSIQTSCSFPMLSVTQTSGSTSAPAANQAPMLSPAMDIGPAEVLTSNCSASTFPQAVTPITSSAAFLAPVPVTSSVINQATSSINIQTKTTLLAPLRTPLQASAQVTNALMPASNSVFMTSPTSSTSNASLMTTASSFSYVHCPAPVSCLGAPVIPILATSSISKLASVPASGSAPLVATLVSSNLAASSSPPLQASLSTLNSTSLVGSGPSPNLASGPVSIPSPMLASVSTSSQSLMQVPSSVLNPVMATNQTSVLGPRTFTLVSNPVQTCVPLTVNCPAPAPAPISVFTAAPMHSTQTLATASSSPHTLVPCHLSPVPNLPPTLNPVFPSNQIPIQTSTPPSLAPSTLMQSIPIAPSLLAKSGSASSQTCSSGVANINNTLPGSTYGMQLVCSTPNPVPRPTVTSAQIFSQEALQNLISVSSNGMLLGSSTSSRPPRSEVTSALIPSQATVHNIVSVPNNAMHLAGSTSTQALTPLPISSSPSAHVGHVTASVSAPNPLSAPAPAHLTSLSGPADHLPPSPLPSVPVNNLPSTTISSLATTLASNSLPSHIASAPKHQQSCSSLNTSTALSQTPVHVSPSGLAAQSLTPTSSTFSTSIVHTTTPCSSTLATSAGRPLTPTNCSLTTFASGSQPQVSSSATTLATWPLTSVNSCLINTADRPPTPVNSSHTTSACRPLTPISCSAATLGTHPLTPLTSYVIGTASRPPTPVNNYPTTLASRPLTPVTNSQTNVVTRPMTPVTSSITTVVSRPLTLVANSLSTVAAHPLTCVSSSLSSAAAWPQTPISSASTLSATQSTAPAASTVLTLTPRTQSSMAFKEELETLMLRSTTPTPPPSTSFLMPRPRRQPPPPPRSPFYLESLEDRRKRQKRERLDRLFRINERHCAQSPIYGTEIIRLCSLSTGTASFCRDGWWGVGYAHCYAAQVLCESKHLDAYWQVTKALNRAILSPQQRMEQLEYLIDRFIFVMPPVEAPAISVHSCHPPPSLTVQQTVFKETLRHELGPRSRGLHRIICNMRTQFPDLRLIQYDCGKLQTLDRLLRQLKAGSHRVLIFTQMTRMLDVLEQFLNYHGHIYLRLDGSTRVEQRQSLMDRFNADKRIFCFILSTRSGGVGVNLTGADTVIFYDSDWNPTMDAQAQDRCHRIGQTRDVHIYRLISERTVEENILKKANQKRMLGDMAIEGGNFTTAYFRQQTIRDLFEMPTEEGTKKESESTSKSSVQEEEDAAPTKQNQILEQALCKAEDEEDIRAATQAKAEQVAELAEFNENIPLDADDSLGREEEEEMSKAEQEIASLVEQLTPIERYAMNFLESSLEDISKEELKQAEEQVEAARKDLNLAKDEVFQLPIEEEEGGTNEENHSKKSKKSKAFNRPERPGTRVSERLRGTRISGMEFEETAHNTSMELLQKKTQPINEPLEKKAMEQTDMDMRKLSGGAQRSPLTIPENVSLHQQDTIKLLAGGKQDSEGGAILSSQPPGSTRDCKQKSLSFSEPKLAEEDQQEQLASRSADVDCVQNERDMVREVRLQSAHSPSKDSPVKGEFFALSSFRSGETQLLLRLPNVSKDSQARALEDMFCDNTPACAGKEGQFQSQNLQSLSMEVSLSKEVGEGTSATQETLPLLPRIEECVPFIKEVEQSEIAEPAEIARETGHPSRKITQSTDLTDLLKTLNDTSTVALEVASVKEIGSSKILCNHMLENSEVNQVVEDPKVNLITTSREISYPSKTVERQRHRRASQSHKPEALPRVALERLVSPSERTCSESCQVKDGFAGTTDESKQPPEFTEQKPDTQHSQRLKDLTEPTLCATSKVVELTSDRDLNTSVSSVAKSDDFPEKNHSQNTQFLSIEADDTPTTKSTRLNDEILITTDHTESVVLHQKFTSKLEAFNSENTAKSDHSMTTVHKEGLLGADVHAISDDKETENISISIKKGKSETSLERKQLVCDEVVLCKGSTSHLALDDSALSKESFDRLPMCEVQLYKEKLCPLLLDEVVSSEGSIPSAKTCDMKVRVGHQYVEEVSENTRHPPCRSSLETSAPSEEGVESTADQLKPSPPRTPRRRTNADGEILQNQKDDDSPTAKVLRKLPGRIVTIVEDRLPVKRKRKSSRSQNSDNLLSSVSPAVCSANSTSNAENTMKESPAARDHHTKRMWQSTKELAEGCVRQHSEDLPNHQTTIPPETKMTQKSSLPANQFPTTVKPDKVSGTLVQTDSSHSMSMIPVSSTNTSSGLALSIDSQVEILSPCLKRKRGRPRKIKPEDSPDCQSPIPMSADNELPETVLPPSKCLEQASEGNNAEQSIFPTCNLQGNKFPNSTSPIQSPAQETSPLSDTSASTGAVKNHNKAKPCEIESSASPKGNRKSVDTKTEKSQDEEVQLRKKGSPKKGSPDKTSVESEDQSDNSLPLDKPKRGRPPRVRETNADLSPLSSCFSLVVTNENITCPISVSDTAPQSNIFTYSSSTPMGVTDVSFTHSADSSSTSAHASSTDAKVSTDGSCTPGRDSTDASFTPARIPATNVSARVSTDDSPSTPKIKADACPTPSKRKRGRPPKMQSPTPEERCSLPSASEQESSLDEAKNLKPPAKRATRKKRRVRAEENVTSQSQLSDSETSSSSSSESPPLTRLARVKMESSGHRDVKEIKSGGDSSSQTAPSIQSPATQIDFDCERLQLSSSRPDATLQTKTAECTVYPRSKNEVPLLKKLDNSSSQDSSASEIKSPRSEGIPRGRCTRNTPSESLVPALESEKDILRKVRRQSCIETSVRQSKMRTDSEIESTSEEDSTRPSKRLRGESERTRKSQGQSTAPESVADRILRSVAAAAAAAAMSPASNTRSSAVTSPPPSTQSPSLVRKFGSQNITTLGNRGRKPKT